MCAHFFCNYGGQPRLGEVAAGTGVVEGLAVITRLVWFCKMCALGMNRLCKREISFILCIQLGCHYIGGVPREDLFLASA